MRIGIVLLLLAGGCVGELATIEGEGPGPSLVDGGPGRPGSDAGAGADATLPDAGVELPDAGEPPLPPRTVWKAAVIAGDNSINAFDNARETIHGMFIDDGLLPENIVQLSRTRETGVLDMSVEGLMNAMLGLDVADGEGCAIFMTSHGSPDGFYIEGRSTLSPYDLADILDEACGNRPTVVLVSACYSGVFIEPLAAPNRIILTAARPDRTSFGCSAEETYTYWDGCLVDSFPGVSTWEELYERVTACVEEKESGGFTPSEPQASFGDDMVALPIFDRE